MDEFVNYILHVRYFLGRDITTEELLFEVMDGFDDGKYAEQVAEELGQSSLSTRELAFA